MFTSGGRDKRKSRFKNLKSGLDLEAKRRDRENDINDIRRSRRHDALEKRRAGVTVPDLNEEVSVSKPQPATDSQTAALVTQYCGEIKQGNLTNLLQLKNLVSVQDRAPPLKEVYASGVVPFLIKLLDTRTPTEVLDVTLWIITNLLYCEGPEVLLIIKQGLLPRLCTLFRHKEVKIIENVLFCMSNIAGDCAEARDGLLAIPGFAQALVSVMRAPGLLPEQSSNITKEGLWIISNVVRGKPPPKFELLVPFVPFLYEKLCAQGPPLQEESLGRICWSLVYIFNYIDTQSQIMLPVLMQNPVITQKLVKLVDHDDRSISVAALRAIGNMCVSHDDALIIAVLKSGFLDVLQKGLQETKITRLRELCWVLSNIVASSCADIFAMVMQANLVPTLVHLFKNQAFEVRREITYITLNVFYDGKPVHIDYMVKQGIIPPLCDMLIMPDVKLTMVALTAITNMLRRGPPERIDAYTTYLEECGGLDKIENLQNHDNCKVYQLALEIIGTYFEADDDVGDADSEVGLAQGGQSFAFTPSTTNDTFTFGEDPSVPLF